MRITFYFGSISAKALVCQPRITKQQKKKLIPKVVFSLRFKICLFFLFLQALFHIIKILKSEEKVYSKVCIFPLSLYIQRGWVFFSKKRMGTACPSLCTYLSLPLYESGSEYLL